MNHKYARSILALLLALCLCLGMFSTAFAAQVTGYRDPAEHWIHSNNRTNELDANAVTTHETFRCGVCNMNTSFLVFRTPEYTRDGVSAATRNVFFSDGTSLDGETTGHINDGVPGVNTTYTGYHWTKAVCETCGSINSNVSSAYARGKNLYGLIDCAASFMRDLGETVTYEYADSQRHTKTTKGGEYCVFCFGTNHTETSVLERHHMAGDVTAEAGNHRFKEDQRCADCGYSHTGYLAAKAVITNYYGVADGKPHTLTVTDLSDAGVSTAIRYGNTAETCTLTSAPNYTEAGEYTVYYEITYTYGGQSMKENGVAYVRLRPQDLADPPADLLGCADHKYALVSTVPATCTTLGYSRYLCTACGAAENRDYTAALGHNWQDMTVREASCGVPGKVAHICTRCGEVNAVETPAGEHAFNLFSVPATCTSSGYEAEECGICGERHILSVLDHAAHQYIADTTTATCTTGGRTTYRCTFCGDSYTDAYTEPLGHTWDLGTVITAPTCTTDGVKEHRCARCHVTTLESVPATGHDYDETVTPATCQTEGIISRRCKNCGDSSVNSFMAALGHAWDNGTAVTVSNCTGDGVTEYHCTRCDAHYLAASSAAGHTPGPAATCTQGQVCTVCGVVLAGPTGHAYEKTVIPPTCMEGGKTVFSCVNCDSVYEIDPTQPLGHDWDAGTPITTATCTGEGVVEHKCTRCDAAYLEAQSAAGHTPGAAATCTQPQICVDCGAVLKNPTGHSYTAAVTKATCTAMGYTTHVCKFCGDSYKDSYTPTLEHKAGAWIVDREATAYREGQRHKACTVCGKTVETEAIPKLDTTALTDAKGQAAVGSYLVTVRDTASRKPVSRAVVTLDGSALYVTLPEGRALIYTDQTTVTVQKEKDSAYVRNMSVTVTDRDGVTEAARTDRYGQITVPAQPESERHAAYIVGLPDGRVVPSGTMTRAEAAAIFARLLAGKNNVRVIPTATRFSDIPTDAWYAGYVRYLDLCGVVNGCPGGVFKPDEAITRAEFVAMAARFYAAMGGGGTALRESFQPYFLDVTVDDWASAYIWQAAEQGWVLGSGGVFRGGDHITRAEAVTLVNRLLGREADKDYINSHPKALRYFTDLSRDHWAYYDIMEAASGHTAHTDAKGKERWEK